MKSRSKVLFIATILATAYSVYLICYFFGSIIHSNSGAEAAAGVIATGLITPHLIFFSLGAIFGWLGVFLKAAWGALTAAIMYAVGTLFFLLYAMFGIPILILGFVGFAMQRKLNQKSASAVQAEI